VPAIDAFRQGQWQVNLGQALAGQTLGIWGYGKIGQRLARYAQAFDMPVLVWGSDSTPQPKPMATLLPPRVRRFLPRRILSA
jgi:phosphoglycerate dehydrogenase-like enzyme